MIARLMRALGRARPEPAPHRFAIAELVEAVEAQEFLDLGAGPSAPDSFRLLAEALSAALVRERRALEQLEAIEREPRPHGRSHGLGYAYLASFERLDRVRQVRDLLSALAPHEAAVRRLLAAEAERFAA